MERAGPWQRRDARRKTEHALEKEACAPFHLGGRPPGEREQHDPSRIRSAADQMRDAMRERVGLARSRAGDDEKRLAVARRIEAVLDRATLLGVELIEIVGRRGRSAGGERRARCARIEKHQRTSSKRGTRTNVRRSLTRLAANRGAGRVPHRRPRRYGAGPSVVSVAGVDSESTGCPASIHASSPPRSGRTRTKPLFIRIFATCAAEASLGHVQ